MTLTSERHLVDSDVVAFTAYAQEQGWGDGLPLIPPTAERVEAAVAASGRPADDVIAVLPPAKGACTVEKLAVNAVMAGAPPASMRLLIASIAAMAERDFELHALNATTGSVVPAMLVNGEIRHELSIPSGAGCLGGADGNAPSIGRAVRLVMRNVAGQKVGLTSQSVYGTPGRVAGIVFAEWEERSPWEPLAARRGVQGDAVTVFGAMGTMNICDNRVYDGPAMVQLIGRGLAYPGANGYLTALPFSEVIVGINPVWADLIGRAFPDPADVQERIWAAAALPLELWPEDHHQSYRDAGRVRADGFVSLLTDPQQVLFAVCGGLGALHAAALHSWGSTLAMTWPIEPAVVAIA
jgi:hypothetical protein